MKIFPFILLLFSSCFFAQKSYTRTDSLKGADHDFRNFWDVKKYELSVEPDFNQQSISGNNIITLLITKDVVHPTFQIDLQLPMVHDFIKVNFPHEVKREQDFIFIHSKRNFKKGETYTIEIGFHGQPRIAKNAPWDGGWVFSKDSKGNPFVSVAQEGIGASVWLPIKDLWKDEPDQGIVMKIITPKDLTGVGNGRLIKQEEINNKKIWTWEVKNPINAYSIVPNIAKYVNFKDVFEGEKGILDLDYWVLEENLDKAKKQFTQVKPMLTSFEYWFGPYPFYEDSFKLVETPYLGMEHQSNVAYGNQYKNGYLGRDLSGTGIGLQWDFIIIHESGHEWFANNVTAADKADMWIHEGFTAYSETLFTHSYLNKTAGEKYVIGTRKNIKNDKNIIGDYHVNKTGSGDMYYKASNMLHTIRTVINNDDKFREILRGIGKTFYHQTVTSKQIEEYISKNAGIDFSTVFNQYLRSTKIPVLAYQQKGKTLYYQWKNTVDDFNMKIMVSQNSKPITITPTQKIQKIKLKSKNPVKFNENYLITYDAAELR